MARASSRKTTATAEPTRSRRSKVVEEEPKAKRRSRKTEVAVSSRNIVEEARATFNPYANIDTTLDAIERAVGLSDSYMDKSVKRLSTGVLALDIILGGGITAGWYTNFGQEQSCKSTAAVTILAAALNTNVPIISYFDFEGSAEPNYLENILHTMGVSSDIKSIFGVRDEKTGEYIVKPRVRYRSEGIAEKFFDFLHQLEKKLPDKKKIGDSWYYIYESKTLDGKIHKANAAIVGDRYDKSYFKKTGLYRIPAPDGSLQALILVDSYPAMLPEKQDADDAGEAMAVQARMFSSQLKRVKGRMKGKRIAVIGINQLRLRPAVMMGNPEYEACGEALKLYSDVRLRFASRALSGVSKFIGEKVTGTGQIESERSLTSKTGEDQYRYIHVRAHKNKLSRPYLEMYLRLWITDAKGNAQGFDPVFDTFQYLKFTGQLIGRRSKMLLQLKGNEATKRINWHDFKALILGKPAVVKEMCAAIGMKPVHLRKKCFAQVASGLGTELYVNYTLNGGSKNAEEDEEPESD
jgi:RecA/RadA recombinase